MKKNTADCEDGAGKEDVGISERGGEARQSKEEITVLADRWLSGEENIGKGTPGAEKPAQAKP